MKQAIWEKKIQRQRWVKSEILKLFRQSTQIIEDLASNHTGFYHIENIAKPIVAIIDWKKVIFISASDLRKHKKGTLIEREKILNDPKATVVDRWF